MSAHEAGLGRRDLVVLALVYAFFRFTPLGLAMRAAAQNPVSSRLVGIRVGWMLALGWGLAAAIGAIAGMMAAPIVYLDPNMMGGVLLYAFAGAVLGGIDNPFGAVLGGFTVGMLENLLGAYVVGDEVKLSVALGSSSPCWLAALGPVRPPHRGEGREPWPPPTRALGALVALAVASRRARACRSSLGYHSIRSRRC